MISNIENRSKVTKTAIDFEQLNSAILDEVDENKEKHETILNTLPITTRTSADSSLFSTSSIISS